MAGSRRGEYGREGTEEGQAGVVLGRHDGSRLGPRRWRMESIARGERGRSRLRCDGNMYEVGAPYEMSQARPAKSEMRKDEGSPERELIEQSNPRVVSHIEEEGGNPWGR
jgi:hypothetical protein